MLPQGQLSTTACEVAPAAGDNERMSKEQYTKVSGDGLRYAAKSPGSPFSGSGNTRSCFKCGKHRQQGLLQSKRILGRSEMICAPSCNTAES